MREQAKQPRKAEGPTLRRVKTGKQYGADKAEVVGVVLSHPDKLLFPAARITKRMLAEYYLKVAPRMLPHVAGRPISLMRCLGGEGHSCFFQRHAGETDSPHIYPVDVKMKGKHRPYMMIKDVQGLVALVQIDALEIHVWGSLAKAPYKPDRVVFDLDPAPDVKFSEVKNAALQLRDMLKELKLASFLKVTGGKGLHVVVPFAPGPSWDEVKDLSRSLAGVLEEHAPGRFTLDSRKDVRKGKIFLDYLRNSLGASAVAPYSVRARPGASVALPLRWEELSRLRSADRFGLEETLRRLRSDPWDRLSRTRQRLPL